MDACNKSQVITLEAGPRGSLLMPLPDDLMARSGWQIGDRLAFKIGDDKKSFSMRKLERGERKRDGEYTSSITAAQAPA